MRRQKRTDAVAFLILAIVIMMPLSSAQIFDFEQKAKEADVGSAIVVNVAGYEPDVIPSSLIEDGDVTISAFLTSLTPATILKAQGNFEPLYGQALIKQVSLRPLDEDTMDYVRGSPKYVEPREFKPDSLGYVLITLKQIEKEAEVPDYITLNMRAEVTFENVERLYSFIQQDLVLPEDPDESVWRTKTLESYQFFSGRGYIRASEVRDDGADLTVYASKDMVWPYTGAPRPIKDVSLRRGEISDYIRLSEMEGMLTNAFRIKLVDIVNPLEKRARLMVDVGGRQQEAVVTAGSRIYPGSELVVKSITTEENKKEGTTRYIVEIGGRYGTKKVIREFTLPKQSAAKTDAAAQDPCKNNYVLLSQSETQDQWLEKLKAATDEQAYCTAVEEFKKIPAEYFGVEDSDGVPYEEKAYFMIAKIYDEKLTFSPASKQMALDYYKKSIKNGKASYMTEAQTAITRLQQEVESNTVAPYATFEEFGKVIQVRLLDLIGQTDLDKPTVTASVNGETKRIGIGETLFKVTENGITYSWNVQKIDTSSVTFGKFNGSSNPITYRTLYASNTEKIDGTDVYVRSIDMKKYAQISIIPGSGLPLVSVSNFTIHIPIEKRAISLTPNQIISHINTTEEIIKKLDSVITKLDSVVTTWNKVCFFTFAYLTLKNSFLSGVSRTQARKFAMHGIDGKSGWDSFCKTNSGKGRTYGSYESCIDENSGAIEQTISDSQDAISQVNDDIKDYKDKDWYIDLAKQYPDLEKYQGYLGEDLYDPAALRDYRYLQLMKDSDSYSMASGSEGASYSIKKEVDTQLGSIVKDDEVKRAAYLKTVQDLQNYKGFDSLDDVKKKQVFTDLYNANKIKPAFSSEEFTLLGTAVAITPLSAMRIDASKKYIANTPGGEKTLKAATVRDYKDVLLYRQGSSATSSPDLDRINQEYGIGSKKKSLDSPLLSNGGQVYMDEKTKDLYVAQATAFSTGEKRFSYEKGSSIEVYSDGKPYCIPTCNGNYVKVLDFYKDGSPNTIQEWNVGKDGFMCTLDDVPIKHQSLLERPESQSDYNRLIEIASRIGTHKPGDVISACGTQFVVSGSRAQADAERGQPNCYDTMDPSDCMLLFGVCDPVMCPPSRFNLGGSWQVENVVQTGVIGSTILGLQNFNLPYEPVPICLTGILAGLQNIKSILRGYSECLKTAQVSGQSVGICDKIRSIFICEMVWKEAIAIFNIHGGVMKWIGEAFFDQTQGGGEYMTFQSSLQNVADSVSFFTNSYARTAFAAYKARSTDEIGATVCKQFIGGKIPGIGEFIDQLAKPESPIQYTALLTEFPYSETLRQSRYQTFYHIYAGEDQEVTYTAYLENSITKEAFYTTERCNGMRGAIAKGGMASFTVDCIAPSGFDRVCITVNGKTDCGFGKISSAFALNYLNDMIVADEAKRQISSEEDCYPSASRTSPSLGSLTMPGKIDMLSTGIVRVCSVSSPGMGTNPYDWREVGDCGKDSTGRSIGKCWLDMRTVSIKDTERMADVSAALGEQGFAEAKANLGITDLLDEGESATRLAELKKMQKPADCAGFAQGLASYKDLVMQSVSPKVSAEAQFMISQLVTEMAQPDYACVTIDTGSKVESILDEFRAKAEGIYSQYKGQPASQTVYIAQIEKAYAEAKAKINGLAATFKQTISLAELEIAVADYEARKLDAVKEQTAEQKVAVQESAAMEAQCNTCEGFTGCNSDECNTISASCYFVSTGIFSRDRCRACAGAKSCSDFNTDPTKCNSIICTEKANLACIYDTQAEKCVARSTNPSKCEFIRDMAAKWLGTGYGGTKICSPSDAKSGKCTTQCASFVSSAYYFSSPDLKDKQPHGNANVICDTSSYVKNNKFSDLDLLQPGDIFTSTSSSSEFGHTGIYVGKGYLSGTKSPFRTGCYSSFTPNENGDMVFIHSVGPVCYSTYSQLFNIEGRKLITFCRHDYCSTGPVIKTAAPNANAVENAKAELASFSCNTDVPYSSVTSFITKLNTARQTASSGGRIYKDIIKGVTGSTSEDKALIAAIIARESSFNNDKVALNHVGLMQIGAPEAQSVGLCDNAQCTEKDERKLEHKAIPAGFKLYKEKLAAIKQCAPANTDEAELQKMAVSAYNIGQSIVCAAVRKAAEKSSQITFKDAIASMLSGDRNACYVSDIMFYKASFLGEF